MIKVLLKNLMDNNLTLGSVESVTGGLFGSTVTSIAGASKVFKGGIIAYTNDIKEDVVKVSSDIISDHGVVSAIVAKEMAIRGQAILKADIVVSFTGNAGPTVLENKPVGTIYIGIKYKDKTEVYHLELSGNRREIQEKTVDYAIKKIMEMVN